MISTSPPTFSTGTSTTFATAVVCLSGDGGIGSWFLLLVTVYVIASTIEWFSTGNAQDILQLLRWYLVCESRIDSFTRIPFFIIEEYLSESLELNIQYLFWNVKFRWCIPDLVRFRPWFVRSWMILFSLSANVMLLLSLWRRGCEYYYSKISFQQIKLDHWFADLEGCSSPICCVHKHWNILSAEKISKLL